MPKGIDPLENQSVAWLRRQAHHDHNGLYGCVAMDKQHMQKVLRLSTTTSDAKVIAQNILVQLELLGEALKVRDMSHYDAMKDPTLGV